jgi:hypothetical protein
MKQIPILARGSDRSDPQYGHKALAILAMLTSVAVFLTGHTVFDFKVDR